MEKEIIEYLSEKVHEAWQEEKHKQGVYNHPDDIPYSKLAENIKEYDRATVRSVLKALGDIVGGHKMETEDKYEQALARAMELYNAAKVYGFSEDMKRLEYIFPELKEKHQTSAEHWKPSDEQITWLYRAADDASKDSRMKQVLNELLSDLKKLSEK